METEPLALSALDRKKEYLSRYQKLKTVRTSGWDADYIDIAENILPRRGRFFTSEANSGTAGRERKRAILNSKPTVAARTLRALMTSGMASPARRWFLGAVNDAALKEVQSVKDWAYEVEGLIRDTLKKSNVYQSLDLVMGDLGSFGTSVLYVEDDDETVVRGYVFPIGSYVLANSARMKPDTCFRAEMLSVRQLVKLFKPENCSSLVRTQWQRKEFDTEHEVLHLIEPNEEYVPGKLGNAGKPFRSVWMEAKHHAPEDPPFLREGGYHEAPLMMVRWSVTGEDAYGSDCPGFEAIGDAKVLQLTCKREESAFEKSVNPPMVGPQELLGQRSSIVAGGMTYVNTANGKFEPALVIDPNTLDRFAQKIARLEQSIEAAYYADLALMFQRLNQGKMTATEINARQQEQMLLLGSVMERAEEELLRPLLYRTFMCLWRRGQIPQPPPEIAEGAELKFEFVSIMSQAQKLLGTTNIERLLGLVGNLVAVAPDAIDKINIDQAVDEYADALAVQPGVVRSDDEVADIRAARAKQQAQMAQAQQVAAMAEGAKTLAQADTSGDNALTRLLGNVTGTPAPGTVQ